MQHCDEGTIHAWLDGALSSDEQTLIEEHVRQCAECAMMVAEARGMIAGAARIVSALDDVPSVVPPRSVQPAPHAPGSVWRSLRLTPLRAGIAALLMIGVASVFTVRHDRAEKLDLAPRVPPAAIQSPAAQPSPQPATKAASRPASAPKRVAVDSKVVPPAPAPAPPSKQKAASGEPARTADTTPDSKTASEAARQRLPEAMDAYAAGQRAAVAHPAARMYTGVRATSALDEAGHVRLTCYQILRDSLNPRRVMPERFALEHHEPIPAAENPVRSVDSTGRVGGVITSATWRSEGDRTALVSWSSIEPRPVLRLTRTNGGVVASATVEGVQVPMRVLATRCRF